MLIGVNVTSPARFRQAEEFWHEGLIDYFELMLDNFLHVDPADLAARIDGRPVGIHIMSSRFLHRERDELADLAQRMRRVMTPLDPIYVSDHLGLHEVDGQLLPDIAEVDYGQEELIFPLVARWRDLLDDRLLLENYPSCSDEGRGQAAFYERLEAATGVHPLLDFSNAIVAEQNGAGEAARWLGATVSISSCHISGYRRSTVDASFVIDSHDVPVSAESWDLLARAVATGRAPVTLTVERDGSADLQDWVTDLRYARGLAKTVPA